jgi:phosphonate transport system substrate-binding protein
MPYQFTVSPDFTPEHLSGWHIFNTWLQKSLGESIHLELYDDFESQRQAIMSDKVDIIYANPYDAAILVREKGFQPVARPSKKSDEAIVAVNIEHQAQTVEDLQTGIKVASTDDPDIHMMGMIMLEPADLNSDNIVGMDCDSYVLVAKALLNGDSDVGFFLAEAFNDLSGMVRKQLRPLVTSQIQVIHHSLMVGPSLAERHGVITEALLAMGNDAKGTAVLESLGLEGWEPMEQEEMEFMIDLMDTLAA